LRLSGVAALAAVLFFTSAAGSAAPEASRLRGEVDAKGLAQAIARDKGKVVLVNFWATWCVPCREEFPDLVRLEAAYRDKGLAVLGVSTDLGKDLSAVEKFLATHKPGFSNYHKAKGGDDQDFIDAVDPRWGGELPFTVLYDREGRKVQALSGKHSYAELEREIAKLLSRSNRND
jgi:thiol-disulfide isomerase/thioredoxin